MKLDKALSWSARIVLLTTLAITIFLSAITMAVLLVRILPFVTPLLNTNINAISSSQGAQFVNAAYSVSPTNAPLLDRFKLHPLTPVLIGVAILRKIRPIDGLFRRFIRPASGNNIAVSPESIPGPSFNMEIPDASGIFEADGSLSGIAPGDTVNSLKGKYMNLGLSLLFLFLVVLFILLSSLFLKFLIDSFNKQSKQLVSGTVQLSEELKALPTVLEELNQEENNIKKKVATKRRKKVAS